ncbi:MAG TPA: cohesin domain-containing protein [Candidatus Sulfotelmatobacter sp.]|nr:cohesin domain-containing protein [Candidatus Sulfotelmatobacter sp.]
MDEVAAQPNQPQTPAPAPAPVAQPVVTPPMPEPKKGMAKKTLLLIIVLFLVAFGLVGLALYLNNSKPKVTEQVVPQVTPDPVQTVLTISSTPTPLSTPSAYKTDVVINTGQNSVTSVQLELSYDPKVLTKVDINSGSFFPDSVVKIKTIDPVAGRITFVISVPDQQDLRNGVLGQGIIATINFSVLPQQLSTPTSITFLPKTEVSAENMPNSVLKSSVDAKFTLNSFGPTFTPTPTTDSTPKGSL